jgi:hypothetical protein
MNLPGSPRAASRKPRSKPTLWPTRGASPGELDEAQRRFVRVRGAGDVGVRDAVHLGAEDRRPGLTKVEKRSTILPSLDSHGADLDQVGDLGVAAGRLDVDDDELGALAAFLTNSRTEPVPGSR